MLGFRAFRALQEKARRHLPPHASLRRAKLGEYSQEIELGTLESELKGVRNTGVIISKTGLNSRISES